MLAISRGRRIGHRFRSAVALVGLAASVGLAGAARGSDRSGSELIAFDRTGKGERSDIYVIRPDGSGLRRVTFDGRSAEPAWSPDGQRIVFARYAGSHGAVWIMNANGKAQRLLTRRGNCDSPAWSPDERTIVFVCGPDRGGADIYRIDADGTRRTRLTGGGQRALSGEPVDNLDPRWAPSGREILFVSDRDSNAEIYVMDPSGGRQRGLTSTVDDERLPDPSPDGRTIVFDSNRDSDSLDGSEIYSMSAGGGRQRRLTRNPKGNDTGPVWSPDGRRIAFARQRPEQATSGIFLMNRNGSAERQLTRGHLDADPAWRPRT